MKKFNYLISIILCLFISLVQAGSDTELVPLTSSPQETRIRILSTKITDLSEQQLKHLHNIQGKMLEATCKENKESLESLSKYLNDLNGQSPSDLKAILALKDLNNPILRAQENYAQSKLTAKALLLGAVYPVSTLLFKLGRLLFFSEDCPTDQMKIFDDCYIDGIETIFAFLATYALSGAVPPVAGHWQQSKAILKLLKKKQEEIANQ